MKCPCCNNPNNTVLESRTRYAGTRIRRRRECHNCKQRWTTYELVREDLATMTMPPEKAEQIRHAIIDSQNALATALEALTDYLPEEHPAPPSLMETHFAQHQQEQREEKQSA